MNAREIDRHSVTCAYCGNLADERETHRLYEGELCPACVGILVRCQHLAEATGMVVVAEAIGIELAP